MIANMPRRVVMNVASLSPSKGKEMPPAVEYGNLTMESNFKKGV